MALEATKAVFELVLLLADIGLVLTCSALHFKQDEADGVLQGGITLAIICLAGFISNLFHFFRHEMLRMRQKSSWKKVECILFTFLPCYYLLRWSVKRVTQPDSLTVKCWTSTLRIFYCSTGSVVQAIFQGSLVLQRYKLWYWKLATLDLEDAILTTTVAFLSFHAIFGVCGYIWTHYYYENDEDLPAGDFLLIIFSLSLNICGRVAAMTFAMGTLKWYWLLLIITIGPFFVNYAAYARTAAQTEPHDSILQNTCRYFFLIPLAFLSTFTVSDQRVLTVMTTMAWFGCSIPQLMTYNDSLGVLLVWIVPNCVQIVALVAMMAKWRAFEPAYQIFSRTAKTNKCQEVLANEDQELNASLPDP